MGFTHSAGPKEELRTENPEKKPPGGSKSLQILMKTAPASDWK
jgi:hypothetical protein